MEASALGDIQVAIDQFHHHVRHCDKRAYLCGAALVAVGDWAVEFENPRRTDGDPSRYPFRQIAPVAYQTVAASALAAIFDDSVYREEIEREVVDRAKEQLDQFPGEPASMSRRRLDFSRLRRTASTSLP